MKCIYLNMYKNKVGMIGLGNWGKNIYRNLEKLNVLKKIYDSNTEKLNSIVSSKKKIADNADNTALHFILCIMIIFSLTMLADSRFFYGYCSRQQTAPYQCA